MIKAVNFAQNHLFSLLYASWAETSDADSAERPEQICLIIS